MADLPIILGAFFGGIAFLGIVVALTVFFLRRRKGRKYAHLSNEGGALPITQNLDSVKVIQHDDDEEDDEEEEEEEEDEVVHIGGGGKLPAAYGEDSGLPTYEVTTA
ncbi:hypothetical protein HK102_009895, partial [Quaeritorhiza haematococci]